MKKVKLTSQQRDRALRLAFDMQVGNLSNGFLATIALGMEHVYTTDVPVAATNGLQVLINPAVLFSDEWLPEHRVFVMFHEILHVAYMHTDIDLYGSLDREYFNLAIDIRVNEDLLAMGFSRPICGIFDDEKRYNSDTTTLEIYLDLKENGVPKSINQNDSLVGDVSFAEPDEEGEDDNGEGSGSGLTASAIKEVKAILDDLIKTASIVADQSDNWGNLPGNLVKQIKSDDSRQIGWREHLANIPQKINRSGFNYKKFSRRHVHRNVYNPRREQKNLGTIVVAFDTSISVTNEQIALMKGECESLRAMMNPEKFLVICFDTEVHAVQELDRNDPINDIVIEGRGGTALQPIFDYLSKHSPEDAACLLVFSDLECYPAEHEPYFPVFWISMDNPEADVNFGELIHMNTY